MQCVHWYARPCCTVAALLLCCAVLCCAVLCCATSLVLSGAAERFKSIVAGRQPIEASVGPGATSNGQSSSGRNKRQAAGSFRDHSQQSVTAQGVLINNLPAESAEGSSLPAKLNSLPQHAQQDTVINFTLDSTEFARGQGGLNTQHAQHASAPQHAERRQRSQRAESSTHAGFTTTVSMTARCRHQSPESCNSNSGTVSQYCATVHHSETKSSLSVHASLSPRKLSKAAKHGRQGQVPKQSVLLIDQHDCPPAQLQLQELPTHASPAAAPFPLGTSADLQESPPITTQSPQPVTSHSVKQPVSNIVSSESLSKASSIVAVQQAVSRSSSTVGAEANSLQASQVPQLPKVAGPTQPQQQAQADSCSTPAQPAKRPEPVSSESTAGNNRQASPQAAADREHFESKPSLPAVLREASSETVLTSASQIRARHDGRLGSAQQAAPQAQLVTLTRSDSRSSARCEGQAESSASQPQLASLPRSDSASSARRKLHTDSSAPQLQAAVVPHSDSASNARHGMPVRTSAPQLQLAALSGSDSTSSARRVNPTAPQSQLAAVSGSDGASSARHSMHNMDSCQAQPQLQQQTGPDTSREGGRQQAVASTAGTQPPQLRQEMHSDSKSGLTHINSQSDLAVQQERSQNGCSSSSRHASSQSSYATQQDALQPDRRCRHNLIQPSYSAQQEVMQPEYNSYAGASRAEGLALLQEQSQLALATQGSCSDLSREGLEEDNCRLRRALAAIEQQLGMLRNQQVT